MSQTQNYLKLEAQLRRSEPIKDPSYQAALYLLSTDTDLTAAAAKYLSSDGIDFTGIRKATQGADEYTQQLIDVAHNLFSWNSECAVTPFELSRLSYPMLDQVCKAMYISAGQVNVIIQGRGESQPRMELDDSPYRMTVRVNEAIERMQPASMQELEGMDLSE